MKKIIKMLFMSNFERQKITEEKYLSDSVDIYDLEYRERQIAKGLKFF